MDLSYSKASEVVRRLCERLRKERLAQHMTQGELAGRAGVGVNTVSNLEAGRNISFETVIRVAMVLGRQQDLEQLFQPKLECVDDILRYESSSQRLRIRNKVSGR